MKLNSQVFLPGTNGKTVLLMLAEEYEKVFAGGHNLVLADEDAYKAFMKAVRFMDRL